MELNPLITMDWGTAMIALTVFLGALTLGLAIFACITPEDEKDFYEACRKWNGGGRL